MLVLPTNLLKNSVTIYLRIQNSHSENFIESYQRYIEILLALKQLITGTITKKKKKNTHWQWHKKVKWCLPKKKSPYNKNVSMLGTFYNLHSFCSSHREVFSQYVLVALYPLGLWILQEISWYLTFFSQHNECLLKIFNKKVFWGNLWVSLSLR